MNDGSFHMRSMMMASPKLTPPHARAMSVSSGVRPYELFNTLSSSAESRPDVLAGIKPESDHAEDRHFAQSSSVASFPALPWGTAGSMPSLVSDSVGSIGFVGDDLSPLTPALQLAQLPLMANEDSLKKQRRRECHNQVEKRRREHINAMIEELNRLLPIQHRMYDEAVLDEEEEEDWPEAAQKKKAGLACR